VTRAKHGDELGNAEAAIMIFPMSCGYRHHAISMATVACFKKFATVAGSGRRAKGDQL